MLCICDKSRMAHRCDVVRRLAVLALADAHELHLRHDGVDARLLNVAIDACAFLCEDWVRSRCGRFSQSPAWHPAPRPALAAARPAQLRQQRLPEAGEKQRSQASAAEGGEEEGCCENCKEKRRHRGRARAARQCGGREQQIPPRDCGVCGRERPRSLPSQPASDVTVDTTTVNSSTEENLERNSRYVRSCGAPRRGHSPPQRPCSLLAVHFLLVLLGRAGFLPSPLQPAPAHTGWAAARRHSHGPPPPSPRAALTSWPPAYGGSSPRPRSPRR